MSQKPPKQPPPKAPEPRRPDWANRLAKWRNIFAGWQLGTRAKGDPECDAVRDHREVTLLLRAEVNALVILCMKAGAFDESEFEKQFQTECKELADSLARRFPGFQATDEGMHIYDTAVAQETTKGWKP